MAGAQVTRYISTQRSDLTTVGMVVQMRECCRQNNTQDCEHVTVQLQRWQCGLYGCCSCMASVFSRRSSATLSPGRATCVRLLQPQLLWHADTKPRNHVTYIQPGTRHVTTRHDMTWHESGRGTIVNDILRPACQRCTTATFTNYA